MQPARPPPSNRRVVAILVLLAAALPEMITGSTPPVGWTNPFLVGLLLWLYGSGVLVVRELSVRWRTGWPGILLLGAAYAIVEEALTVKTMFDPTMPMLGDLGWYGRWAGVNWVWTVWLMTFHAAFSIAFPILLVEWRWPHLRGRPLLPDWGLHVALFLLAGVALFDYTAFTPYRAGPWELAWAFGTIAALVWASRGPAARWWIRLPTGRLAPRWAFAAAGFAFWGLSFLLYAGGATLGAGIPALTFLEGGALLLLALLLLRRASGPSGERHIFAFVGGSISFFSLFAVILEFAGRIGMSVVGAGFSVLAIWLYRRHGPSRPAEGPIDRVGVAHPNLPSR